MIFARAGRRFIKPRPVTLVEETIEWVEATRYLGVALDNDSPGRLTSISLGGGLIKSLGMLGPLRKRKSDLSVRNRIVLYKQLIRPMMDYACPAWRPAARTHVRRLQVLQSKCLRLATGAPLLRK